ncbi:MAG TPA: hypothetical protein P5279_06580 [Anaerohalosphaeraceae bacterium]|jgi:hypothetical protein|nr:hypothetical protein [Anaerohalosphaeraceae bacterium]HRT50139.1 hypothetical protein [Anaerohalosphaeraceae bacterium]HRT86073.1 hypothetical protein [Anaerohalosphaeraceae bacterium]
MWTLIKREIDDSRAFFITGAAYTISIIVFVISNVYSGGLSSKSMSGWPILPMLVWAMVLFSGMGAKQMYMDKTRRISCFLSTLAVTRSAIFTARVITGVLLIVMTLLPVTAAWIIILKVVMPPIPLYQAMFVAGVRTVLLLSLASYSLGLLTGWAPGRVVPVLGGTTLALILIPLVILKGSGMETAVILVLVTAVSLIRSRQHFISTPL